MKNAELWRPVGIPGFSKSEVSNKGRVRTGNHYHKLTRQYNGYMIVRLSKDDGTTKKFYVHRLVMLSFSPIAESSCMEVNHKDFNKQNNSIDNLEWCTHAENMQWNRLRDLVKDIGLTVKIDTVNVNVQYIQKEA